MTAQEQFEADFDVPEMKEFLEEAPYKWIFPVIANISENDDVIGQLVAVQPMAGPAKGTFPVIYERFAELEIK